MIQRFLFDGVDAKPARAPVTDQADFITGVLPDIAQPPLILVQATVTRAQVALQSAIALLNEGANPIKQGMKFNLLHNRITP